MINLPNDIIKLLFHIFITQRDYRSFHYFSLTCKRFAILARNLGASDSLFLMQIEDRKRKYYILPNGKYHKEHVIFYENGSPYLVSQYINGTIHGDDLVYDIGGRVNIKTEYDHGKPLRRLMYHDNGRIQSEILYAPSYKNMRMTLYDTDGTYVEEKIIKSTNL
jgi:antitoxin component YwqK of YwqJK toxin-antitoxin module